MESVVEDGACVSPVNLGNGSLDEVLHSPRTLHQEGVPLSIIIINWNSCRYAQACLEAIATCVIPFRFETIVFDAGPEDGCGEMIAIQFPTVRYIRSFEQLGFARANNIAVKLSRGETLLFLNPDTEVQSGAIEALHDAVITHRNAGAVGARLLNTDGSFQWSCVQAFPTILNQTLGCNLMLRIFKRTRTWGAASLFNSGPELPEVEAVSGAALMVKRAAFDTVDGFNEQYHMYSEDIDLCYKLKINGWSNYHVPGAVIIHHGGGSSKTQPSRVSCTQKVEAVYRYLSAYRGEYYANMYRYGMAIASILRLALLIPGRLLSLALGGTTHASTRFSKWRFVFQWALCRRGHEALSRR